MDLYNYQVPRMKRYYYKIFDKRVIVKCSKMIEGTDKIVVYFEHIVGDAMCTASCIVPDFLWMDKAEFSDEDIKYFEHKIKEEQEEIFKYAKNPWKIVSEKEAQEIERLLYPNGRRYACSSIADYTESVLVTELEKEEILDKICSYVAKPSKALRGTVLILSVCIFLCAIYAICKIGSKLAMVVFGYLLLDIIALIGVYFGGGVFSYDVWKREVKGIRTHTVYKTVVIPFSVWQGDGGDKNCYMNITTDKGLPFWESHIISRDTYVNIDNMRMWAYFYEDTIDRYQNKYRIYLIGEQISKNAN